MTIMEVVEITPEILQVPARPGIPHAGSHAYAVRLPWGWLLVEPAHWGDVERAWWIDWIRARQTKVVILLTHHHFDHTVGVPELQAATGCEVWAPPRGAVTNFTPLQQYTINRELHEGDEFGGCQVLKTPGHEHEHVVLYWRNRDVLISGDATKADGVGWVHERVASLRRLALLDPETVLPAHGLPILHHSLRDWAPWLADDLERAS